MLQHNTIVSGFILVNDAATNAALTAAKGAIGADEWKKGYSEERCKTARSTLKAAQVPVQYKLTGPVTKVSTTETKDGEGNTYRKVRVALGTEKTSPILSLDVGTEFCERLLPKLGAAVALHGIGAEVTITCFPDVVERDGRTFVNHVASVKIDGEEVKATKPHFQLATQAATTASEALVAAGVKDKKAINAVKASAKEEYFYALAHKLSEMFPSGDASTEAVA